mgnify:CR=1 FL=1
MIRYAYTVDDEQGLCFEDCAIMAVKGDRAQVKGMRHGPHGRARRRESCGGR